MSISLGANGGSYNYPQENDPAGWGDDATNWASAVSAALSNIGLGGTASADAVVNIISTTKGILIPRMTTTQRNAIGSPSTSLLIYNTTTTQYELYTGSTWQSLASYINGTLTVTGAASLQSTLNVTGASTFANVTINGNETVNGVLSVTGNTTLASVTGTNATINGTLSVTGNTTLVNVTGANITSTGTILAASGTSGTPGISFSGDPDTGIYNSAANTLAISTGGTLRAIIDSDGITANVPYWHLVDQKTNGTEGGTITSGAWRTRTLNTTIGSNTITGSSLASSQFTLPTGTYRIFVTVPGYTGNRFKGKLRNITDSSDTLIGSSEYSVNTGLVSSSSFIIGVFTIIAQKTFEIQHQVENTTSIYGGGVNSSFGVNEIYTQVWLWKLA